MKVMNRFNIFFCLFNLINIDITAIEVSKKEVEHVITPVKVIGAAPIVTPGNANATTVVSAVAPTKSAMEQIPLPATASSNVTPIATSTIPSNVPITSPVVDTSTIKSGEVVKTVAASTIAPNPSNVIVQPLPNVTERQVTTTVSSPVASTTGIKTITEIPDKIDASKKNDVAIQKDKENVEKIKEDLEKEKASLEKTKSEVSQEQEQFKNEDLEKQKEKKSKEKQKEKKKKLEEEKLISTLNTMTIEDEGNWLLKRVWWEQAEATFEKIIEVNDEIIQAQTDYFNKSKDVDKQLTNSFRKLGYEQGELNEIIIFLIEETKRERQIQGDLSSQEIQFLDLLNDKKNELEKLKKDLEILESQNALIEDSFSELINQINKSREYERKAWSDFKEIGRILSDKKAKELFYEIDAHLKNVQNILNYIRTDLSNFFDRIINKTKELSDSVSGQVDSLSKEGLNLKEKFNEYKNLEELHKEQQKKKIETQDKIQAGPKKIKKGWLERIGDWFMAPINWVMSFFK